MSKATEFMRYVVTKSNQEDSEMCENYHANWVISCIKQAAVWQLFSLINYVSQKCRFQSIPK